MIGRWAVVVLCGLCLGIPLEARGDSPAVLNYQGFLVDTDGNPVSGEWTLSFMLFDQPDGGLPFFSETRSVNAELGVFTALLGSNPDSPLPAQLFEQGEIWLGIAVHGDDGPVELLPRQQVASVPYALQAQQSAECGVCALAMGVGDGICIAPDDLAMKLDEACPNWCFGDADVDLLLAQKGYLTQPDLEAFLGQGGYCTECYSDEQVQAYLDAGGYTSGPHFSGAYGDLLDPPDLSIFATTEAVAANYCPLPCYGDPDVELVLDAKGYCDTCYSDADVEQILTDKAYCQTCYSDDEVFGIMGAAGCSDCTSFLRDDGSVPLQNHWDTAGNQLLNIVIHNAASEQPPEDPAAGQLYWDTDDKAMKVFDGQQWVALGKAALQDDVTSLQENVATVEALLAALDDVVSQLETSLQQFQASLAAHQGEPHLTPDQHAALTGGPEVSADAYHTHEASSSGLENVNPDLLNSVFSKTYAHDGLPQVLEPLTADSFVIHVPVAGSIMDIDALVALDHPSVNELTLKLRSPLGTEVVLVDKDTPGNNITCSFDKDCECSAVAQCMEAFVDEDPKGDWTLTILDLVPGNATTLNSFELPFTYMSSETLEVKGDVKSSVGSLSTNLEFILLNMLGSALAGDAPAGQVNLVVNPTLAQATNAEFKDAGGTVQFGTILDLHDDGELDAGLWTCAKGTGSGCTASANCAESGTSLVVSAMGCGSSGWAEVISSGFDAKSFGVDVETVVRVTQSRGAGGGGFGNTHTYAYVTDALSNQFGGNTGIAIDTDAQGTYTYNYLFLHDEAQLIVWRDGVEVGGSPFSLAALPAWRLHFKAVASEGSCSWPNKDDSSVSIRYELYRVEGIPGSGYVTTKPVVLDVASDKALVKLIATPDGASQFNISARTSEQGAFTAVENMGIGLLPASGTEGTLRFGLDWSGTLNTDSINIGSHELEYAAYFIWE